jgi:hypothetical protein
VSTTCHRTLHAALGWTWRLLERRVQTALAALSIIASFDVGAGAAIIGAAGMSGRP